MADPTHESTRHAQHHGITRRLVVTVLSLQCKGIVLVAGLLLTVTAAVAGYLLDSSAKEARQNQDLVVVQLAAMLAKAGSIHMADQDRDSLLLLASKAANAAPLLYAMFVDANGHELAAAEHTSIQRLATLRDRPLEVAGVLGRPVLAPGEDRRAGSATLDITYPITIKKNNANSADESRTELIGYVRTGVVAHGWQRSMMSRLNVMIGVGVIVAVVAIPLGFILVRRIVSPLESLTLAMLRFSQGELNIRSPVKRRDEIGRLALAFNRMADKHQRAHERVLRLNSRLEERVAQRTQQLRDLAAREPLTGLYNRRHFNEVLSRSLAEAVRYDAELTVIMIDLDNFKQVNDQFGHDRGDEVLIAAANTIHSRLRSSDVAARFGGDEFILLLPQTGAEQASTLAGEIVERFQVELDQRVPEVPVSMSMGIASLRDMRRGDPQSLIRAADRALYRAKAAGKNSIAFASEQAPSTVI